MEIKIEEYGRHMFSVMTSEPSGSEHWESIRKEAEPLVRQLIALNDKMKGGGYKLTGYIDSTGKKKLPDHERIKLAQEKLWKVSTAELEVGDKIWTINEDLEMHIGETEPGTVEDITAKAVYIELRDWEDYTQKFGKNKDYFVLRAPKDWDKKEDLYSSDKYWLKQADKLGI